MNMETITNIYRQCFYMFCIYYYYLIESNCNLDMDSNITTCDLNFNIYNNILCVYLIFDSINYFFTKDYIYIVHHAISLIPFYFFGSNRTIYIYNVKMLMLTELSNFFLGLTYIHLIPFKKYIQIIFAIVYLTIRPYVYYNMNYYFFSRMNIHFIDTTEKIIIGSLIVTMSILNTYWAIFIIKKIIKTINIKSSNKND